ncbi:MAG: 16S rRNA (guanine(527)-N(7))-methyltransferase RsmG [Ruminococcus sp.]|nr:16S rRNA (guanine(527)-N(7))-methyltransferase RsmG [Ruminococcus sp.]
MLPDFELCCSEFEKNGIGNFNREIYDKMNIYAEFLVGYNRNVNLTAITEPHDILIKHFVDSAAVLNFVDIPENSSLIDVGTGAGFPSVPIKLFRNDIKLTLLDSLDKRITFLKLLCEKLGIEAEFIHGRAEDIADLPEYREKFDFSCARAVANLAVLSEYCLPFVKVGGKFFSLKGPNEQIESAENAINVLGGCCDQVNDYSIDGDQRRIVQVNKISQTPSKYPRNSAQIKKKPL